jgi:hypothetical protein
MNRVSRSVGFVAGLILAASVARGQADATTQPSDASITALIQQLSDDDFSVRDAATAKLAADGMAAKPALEVAARDADPERSLRAKELLRRLEAGQADAAPAEAIPFPDAAQPAPGQPALRISSRANGNMRVTDATIAGLTTHIEQGPDGIVMTVKGTLAGRPYTAHYKAADGDALLAQSPRAYALWQRLGAGTGRIALGGNINPIFINGGNLVVAQQQDDIPALRDRLMSKMQHTNLSEQQKAHLLEELQRIALMQQAATSVTKQHGLPMQKTYLDACDDFRKQLAALGLPDPGADLPPPASSRLGVSINGAGNSILITMVDPGSRGEKIGLREGDVIQSVNGKPMGDVHELRTAVMANPHLTLSVLRDGKEITLTEGGQASAQ